MTATLPLFAAATSDKPANILAAARALVPYAEHEITPSKGEQLPDRAENLKRLLGIIPSSVSMRTLAPRAGPTATYQLRSGWEHFRVGR